MRRQEVVMRIVSRNDPDGPLAQNARKWFAKNGPPDLQPLPLGYTERERLKHGGADHILAWYARSLDGLYYDISVHPSFYDYACGLMASEFAPGFIKDDETLKKRFPPRDLAGLGPGFEWETPKVHAETMREYRRHFAKGRETHSGHTPSDETVKLPDSARRCG
jgi:hypothetical protein